MNATQRQKVRVAVVDFGAGNVSSVVNALRRVHYWVDVISRPDEIDADQILVLPGVGSFGGFISGLEQRGLAAPLLLAFERDQPLLGICVGMQAFLTRSAENPLASGLSLVEGRVLHLRDIGVTTLRTPHVGWNSVLVSARAPQSSPLRVLNERDVYFMHSFAVPDTAADSIATTSYEVKFSSAIQVGNWLGVQFHPEKSHYAGLEFLEAWIASQS